MTNAQATGSRSTLRNATTFIGNLDGLLYDDDPKEGIVQGSQFLHPVFRLKFTAPSGFSIQNGTTAVSIVGQSGQAQFTGGAYNGNLESYVQSVFQGLAGQGQAPSVTIQRGTTNGIATAYGSATMSNSQGSRLDVTVIGYEFGPSSAYHFVVLTPAGQGLGGLSSMVNSVTRMSDNEAAGIKPRRVRLVTVRSGDTAQSLASRMAYGDYQLDRFLVLNGLAANAPLKVGRRVKIVSN